MALRGNKYKANGNKNILESFKHAYDGVNYSVVKERNMHIHLVMASLVIIFGVLFEISHAEWLACFILIGSVIALEIVNTAIELIVDMITTENSEKAKAAKDVSAGAVLVMAVVAAAIGLIIFVPKIFWFLMNL